MTTVYLEVPLTAEVTRYHPAQSGSGGRFGRPDPEALEYTVRLPCGCKLDLTDAQAREVDGQIRVAMAASAVEQDRARAES